MSDLTLNIIMGVIIFTLSGLRMIMYWKPNTSWWNKHKVVAEKTIDVPFSKPITSIILHFVERPNKKHG